MNKIKKLVSQKDWDLLISNYQIKEVCSSLSFSEAMQAIKHLFYDDIQDDRNQEYAIELAFEIKDYCKNEWEGDWKNEIFLGGICAMHCLYEERYLCYKRAYDLLKDSPAELLYLLSICNNAPGIPPITGEESELYLKKSIEKKITSQSALAMKNVYQNKGDKSQEHFWDQVYQKLEKENVHFNQLIPDVFK